MFYSQSECVVVRKDLIWNKNGQKEYIDLKKLCNFIVYNFFI